MAMHIIRFQLSAMSGIDKSVETDPWLPGTTVTGEKWGTIAPASGVSFWSDEMFRD